jgi:CheY-specific phosphatase CheX
MRAAHFDSLLEGAVAEVLESMCFLSTGGETALPASSETAWVARKLEFRGPLRGSFGVQVPLDTARLLASNLLGEEGDDVSDEQAGEAVGELANIVCGVLLGRIDSRHTFDLSAPRAVAVNQIPAAGPDRVCRTIALDDGVMMVWLEVRQGE